MELGSSRSRGKVSLETWSEVLSRAQDPDLWELLFWHARFNRDGCSAINFDQARKALRTCFIISEGSIEKFSESLQ